MDSAFRALEEEKLITKVLGGDVDLLRGNDMSEVWHKEVEQVRQTKNGK